ncbi:MAG: 2-C-methyl-D-erythritol 2,4-cyclodiphosphate synthase [Syntrophales bacterium]|jgi:2-C-methyl-D-erythritol 2,4-cyclodiphosphate synthase|nr:2-C-methyl-D-erythritol 2,4-cyclodiphosphate synthase [Syntrophales bacterium]MDY0043532.1 2-C-methyl-D-erythritol 2,4-cyclodiphosphate synthase [Syntrophales bacterium]
MHQNTKIGFGYDSHRFAEGRKLFLGGVEIPFEKGLSGHSDADVLLHAIADALLGALGRDDIGVHFPDTDPSYKDISSKILILRVKSLLDAEKYTVGNIDATVVLERPRLRDYIHFMKTAISMLLGIETGQVNIKATTNEGMGFTGRGEGIAAYSVVTIIDTSS